MMQYEQMQRMNKDKKATTDRNVNNLDPSNDKLSNEMRTTLVKFEQYCTKMESNAASSRRYIASTKAPRNPVTGQLKNKGLKVNTGWKIDIRTLDKNSTEGTINGRILDP